MASTHKSLSVKHFFTVFFTLLLTVGLVGALYSVQHPTNTQSDASGCTNKPKLILDKSEGYTTAVIYDLKLVNTCPKPKDFIVKVDQLPEKPVYYKTWQTVLLSNGAGESQLLLENVENSTTATLIITRPLNATGTKVRTDIVKGTYRYFVIKAYLKNNPEIYDTLSLSYTVD